MCVLCEMCMDVLAATANACACTSHKEHLNKLKLGSRAMCFISLSFLLSIDIYPFHLFFFLSSYFLLRWIDTYMHTHLYVINI